MLFNSLEFAIFLPLVFAIYWLLSHTKLSIQNSFLLISSYVFYGWWDWRFLSLIIFSSFVDFFVGQAIQGSDKRSKRRLLLTVSILVNLGFLGFFKYYNFFAQNFSDAFTLFGSHIEPERLNIILPVGISFYTFQTMSYTIDVYRRKMDATNDFISFFSFVSFFPQLVAGPIERATNLLPQFYSKREFDYHKAVDGCRQILWGLFKKIVIADNCAEYANMIFDNSADYSGSTLFIGAVFFAFQIYGDFSGYSDIAIGTSRLFGFHLMRNFAFPYFSRDIAEFWRRWHISLSTWFRDYLYIPLGGSKGGPMMQIRNTFIIFLVSGFWHGANWTFLIWGALNALYFLPLLLLGKNRSNLDLVAEGKLLPNFKESYSMLITFSLTVLAWVFFRAESASHALSYLNEIISISLFTVPEVRPKMLFALITVFIFIEWVGREQQHALFSIGTKWRRPFRWSLYYIIIFVIIFFAGKQQEFIYFQF